MKNHSSSLSDQTVVSKDQFCRASHRSMLPESEPSRLQPGNTNHGFCHAAVCSADEILNDLRGGRPPALAPGKRGGWSLVRAWVAFSYIHAFNQTVRDGVNVPHARV